MFLVTVVLHQSTVVECLFRVTHFQVGKTVFLRSAHTIFNSTTVVVTKVLLL